MTYRKPDGSRLVPFEGFMIDCSENTRSHLQKFETCFLRPIQMFNIRDGTTISPKRLKITQIM